MVNKACHSVHVFHSLNVPFILVCGMSRSYLHTKFDIVEYN